MAISKKKWGYLEWFDENLSHGVNVGIVVMNPGSHHAPHKHYDEQIIYVLQGQAISIVNGVESSISAGSRFHWQAGITHEVYNIGNTPLMHLLVSIPHELGLDADRKLPATQAKSADRRSGQAMTQSSLSIQLNEILDQLRSKLLDQVTFPYAIFDSDGRYMIGGQCSSQYCERMCNRSEMQEFCPCMMHENPKELRQEQEYVCPHHLNIINVPIYVNQQFLGAVQGGYYWSSHYGELDKEELYDVPESTELMMHDFLHQISRIIVSYYEYEQNQMQFSQTLAKLEASENSQNMLMGKLKAAESQVTDLRINHHFLFNSLNSMSAMALRCGSPELHQSIVDLSRMFQYTLRTQSQAVTLGQELSYVTAYLNLQKIRFKEQLSIVMEIAPECRELMIPFNVIQPIVENAFVHGFHNFREKQLHIRGKRAEKMLVIEIRNSGELLSREEKDMINYKILGGAAHGLSMVYHKIQNLCGPDAKLELATEDEGMTCFRLLIPIKEGQV